ncbi:MAG: hypothetical protein GY749_37105 [Desulfobacteraceae bacterium]|nr:hypothetical protein [Desulfobacteraceae bacterium]
MIPGLQQADDLWNAVKQETDQENRQIKMLEFARVLLKFAAMEDSAIKEISRTDQLTDCFIEYLEAADLVSAFFNRALPHLEPELAAGEFERQIREAGDQLAQILEQSKNLHRANADLLEQKNCLMAESQKLNDLKSELDNLRRLEEQIKPENMNALEQELDLLKQKTGEKQPEKERLDKAIQAAEQMLESLKENRDTAAERLLGLSEELAQSLDYKWEECDIQLSAELGKLKQKNIMYREITGKLDECVKNLQELAAVEENNRELYQRHFSANAEISGSMGHVSQLSEDISQKLNEFDLELKQVIQAGEDAVRQIRRLNKTG